MQNKGSFSGCGIAGVLLHKSYGITDRVKESFSIMLSAMKHRGPDGFGVYIRNQIILGHRRLSILDTSNKGAQPMTKDHLTITLNGEYITFRKLSAS
jgi:asparagine synthase (glutamine-hydrolysing)